MTKHTPGPWAVYKGQSRLNQRVKHLAKVCIVDKDDPVAVTYGHTLSEAKGNARLIAAAPELLAALKDLRGKVQAHPTHSNDKAMRDRLARCDAAIARAEGKIDD